MSFSHFLMQSKYCIGKELNDLGHDLELLQVKIKTNWLFEGHELDELMQVLEECRLAVKCSLNEDRNVVLSQVAGRA